MAYDRMFQVIVLGGVGLVGACGSSVVNSQASCTTGGGMGGATGSTTSGMAGFPQEGASTTGVGGFPQETASITTTASGMGGFPQEGPAFPDAGPDGAAGFPNETDQ